jgi:hypothetical protein
VNGTTETNMQAEVREARPVVMEMLDRAVEEARDEIAADRVTRRLWPHEMGYWLAVQDGVDRAQELLRRAQELETEAIGLLGARNHYRAHLGQVHDLAEVDTIQPDGTFVRAAEPEPAPQAVPQVAG